jgi:hypothetical protein
MVWQNGYDTARHETQEQLEETLRLIELLHSIREAAENILGLDESFYAHDGNRYSRYPELTKAVENWYAAKRNA